MELKIGERYNIDSSKHIDLRGMEQAGNCYIITEVKNNWI